MAIDLKNCSIHEILENKALISSIKEKDEILKILLVREDKKVIMNNIFRYFLINTNANVLEIISSEKYSDVFDDLIKENFEVIVKACIASNNVYMLTKFTNKYFEFLLDNFNLLIEDKNFSKNLSYFLKSIYEEKILDKYKDEILDATFEHLIKDSAETILFDYLVMNFFIYLDKIPDYYIGKNIEKFIVILNEFTKKINVDRLEAIENEPAFIINTIIKKSNKIKGINDFLNKNIDFIISLFTDINKKELNKMGLYDFYLELIKDLLRIEKKELKDIKFYNGGFSNVIIIGDKVLKTGEKNSYKIPYDKRLLQPIIRQYIKGVRKCKSGYYEIYNCVEVYERVDTKDITDDDVYLVFKELLEKGILWADAASRNLGRLLKPNKIYLPDSFSIKDGKKGEYYVDDKDVGFESSNEKNKEYMQKGDLVIIDEDEIYDINKLDLKNKICEMPNGVTVRYIDDLIRKTYCIDTSIDYLAYMQMYIEEQKIKNSKNI